MIRKIIFLSLVAVVCCQYPRQRAPPMHRPPPEEYEEEYAPPPRPAPPAQPAFRQNTRPNDVYRPASVHYVNIGLELAGDYKFGYDTGKGNEQSFREETRLPDGSVQGAYGYVDETGAQRIVKYTAGKEGFKVLGDEPQGGSRSAPARQAPPPPAPAQPAPPPQPAYSPPPQQAYAPQPAPRPQPPPAPRPQPQPAYRPAPQPQPAYRPPPPQPQPAYRARPQPAYAPEPESYAPRPRKQARRPPPPSVDYDYEDPNNEITERRLVPVDTSLFNYNIGSSHDKRN